MTVPTDWKVSLKAEKQSSSRDQNSLLGWYDVTPDRMELEAP